MNFQACYKIRYTIYQDPIIYKYNIEDADNAKNTMWIKQADI